MSQYIYNDEDNNPMNDDPFDQPPRYHNVTTYSSTSEMKAVERGEVPFNDPPDDGCWNCLEYDGNRCHLGWNNNDESYYNPDTDDKEPDDWCPGHDTDKDAVWEDFFGEEEF